MQRAILFSLVGLAFAPAPALADKSNPVCPEESVYYNPGDGEDIVVPREIGRASCRERVLTGV